MTTTEQATKVVTVEVTEDVTEAATYTLVVPESASDEAVVLAARELFLDDPKPPVTSDVHDRRVDIVDGPGAYEGSWGEDELTQSDEEPAPILRRVETAPARRTVTLELTDDLVERIERLRANGVTACENDDRGTLADAIVAATA